MRRLLSIYTSVPSFSSTALRPSFLVLRSNKTRRHNLISCELFRHILPSVACIYLMPLFVPLALVSVSNVVCDLAAVKPLGRLRRLYKFAIS